jgi:hypothetical protein
MRSILFVALGTFFLLSGCSKKDDISPNLAEQQKINEDILKSNQDALDKINQKAKEIAVKQKEIHDALNKLETKKQDLSARESKLNVYAKELAKREENVKKLLAEQTKLAEDMKNQNAAAENRSAADNKRTLFLDELAADWAKAAQNSPHLPEILETEREKELDDAISNNQSDAEIKAIYHKYFDMAGTLWYNNIMNYLQENDVIRIQSDAEFEKTARQSVQKFLQQNTAPDDFDKIENNYKEFQAAKKHEK